MGRVSFVRLLLAHVTGSDLRCIPDPDLVSQILHQFDEPLAVARGLRANQHRRRQLLIEQLGVPRSMHQLLSPGLSRLRVQPRNLLPAGMEITPYNHHAKTPFFPASLILNTRLPGSNRAFALIQSTHSRFLRMCVYPRQLFSVPFSSHPTGERHHRHRTQTRATMKSDGSSPKCAVKPRWPSSLLQNPFSALFENRNGNKLALPRPKSLFRNTLTISHLQ